MFAKMIFLLSETPNANSTQNAVSDVQRIDHAISTLGSNLPTVFQTLGLALLGILIPLTIAVLQDLLQKKVEEDTNFSVLDLHVILDRVFQVKNLLVFSAMVFVPFVFWEIENGIVRMVEISLATIGIAFIVKIIWGVYQWSKGDVSSFREDYLRKLTNKSEMVTVWKSVWNNKKMSYPEEKDFFDIFSQKIDYLMNIHGKRK
jgi:hypothetical protein